MLSAGIFVTSKTKASRFQTSIEGNQHLTVRNASKLTSLILNFGLKISVNKNRENSRAIFYNYSRINIWFPGLEWLPGTSAGGG
jgi:hypothetical protein